MEVHDRITFKTLGGETRSGRIRDATSTLGAVAADVATDLGLAGTVAVVNADGEVLEPETPLADLDERHGTLTLAPALTPA